MSEITLESLIKEFNDRKNELTLLRDELAKINSIQTITVDLTKNYETYLTAAEAVYAANKRTFVNDITTKKKEIAAKIIEINDVIKRIRDKLVTDSKIDLSY